MQKKFLTFTLVLIPVFGLRFKSEAFNDVNSKHKNFEAITKLNELGIINGYNDGTFKPSKGISHTKEGFISANFLFLKFCSGSLINTPLFAGFMEAQVFPHHLGPSTQSAPYIFINSDICASTILGR